MTDRDAARRRWLDRAVASDALAHDDGSYPVDLESSIEFDAHLDLPQEEGARYAPGLEIGRGAMGRVRLVHDARLVRDIAWKEGDALVLREAWITAQLEHPGIVPVHDLGTTDDGQSFFAMRAVRGRTLAEVLAEPSDGVRLPLVRAFLQVVNAVGWAHHRGVVHRDLKPANILVGPFGEVQVIDWGLAHVMTEAPEPLSAGAIAAIEQLPIQRGAIAGTPRYMSPEQAVGAAVDARADIWSLGVILYELASGRVPFRHDEPGLLAQLQALYRDPSAAVLVPIDEAASGCPPELRAIITRAVSPEPAARYPDARALARDLEAFLDGRRVHAYSYRTRDHLVRFVRAFKLPLAITAAVLITIIGVGLIALDRIADQRDAALAAQARTDAALRASDRHLAEALVGEARTLMRQGMRADPEVLAARAVTLDENPEARGILAHFKTTTPPQLTATQPAPCVAPIIDPSGQWLGCRDDSTFVLWRAEPLTRMWSMPMARTRMVVFAAGGTRLVIGGGRAPYDVVEAADGTVLGRFDPAQCSVPTAVSVHDRFAAFDGMFCILIVDAIAVTATMPAMCEEHFGSAIANDGRIALSCGDGWLALSHVLAPHDVRYIQTGYFKNWHEARALAFADDGFVVADAKGAVSLLDHNGAVVLTRQLINGLARVFAVSPDRKWLAIAGEDKHVTLVALPGLGPHGGLPTRDGEAVHWRDDNTLTTVGKQGPSNAPVLRRWAMREGMPLGLSFPGGITSLAVRDETLLVAHQTDATRIDLRTGEHHFVAGNRSVTKSVEFDADGHGYLGSTDGRFVQMDEPPYASRPLPFPGIQSRRYIIAGEWYFAAPFGRPLWATRDPTSAEHLDLPSGIDAVSRWTDVTASPIGPRAKGSATIAALQDNGDIWMVDVAPWPEATYVVHDDSAAAVAPFIHGELVAAAGANRVTLWQRDGAALTTLVASDTDLLDVATDTSGLLVAAGARDGAVFVWHIGDAAPRLVFRGHTERVAALVFDPRGHFLASGGWDGRVHFLALDVLTAPAGALAEGVASTWPGDATTLQK